MPLVFLGIEQALQASRHPETGCFTHSKGSSASRSKEERRPRYPGSRLLKYLNVDNTRSVVRPTIDGNYPKN